MMVRNGKKPFGQGLKPSHVVVFFAFVLLRQGLATEGPKIVDNNSPPSKGNEADNGAEVGLHLEEAEEGVTEFTVFHVNFHHVELPFIIALWIFISSLAKVGFHMTPKLHTIFPESCLLVVVGILIGFLLFLTAGKPPSTLTPNLFFLFMLPPIILDAGYFMPNRLFFDHLGTILLMAIVGTIWNMLTIGTGLYLCGLTGIYGDDPPNILETFLFSSLISAVDPVAVLAVFEEIQVDEILYIVVFGESLLNDAVTVVLYEMFETYAEIGQENLGVPDVMKGFASFFVVALGGAFIGIIWGFVTGFVTRFTSHARILEPLFVFVMAYLSYLTAEIFKMSSILAITFCGITMKNYVERNISSKSQTTLKYAMKMLSGSSETIIFMFLGVATIHDEHEWNWAFIGLTILFASVFRAIGVLIFAGLANNYRLHKLSSVDQFVMMYGGLRGAVAFALVLLIDKKIVPHASMFVTTTIAMIYWTVFVQGITIKPLVKFLNVKTKSDKEPSMNERIAGRFMDHVVAGMEGILGEVGNLRLRDMYKRIDQKYIKPCILRENHFRDPKIIETYENLTNKDALEFMKRNPTQFAGVGKSLQEMAELPSLPGGKIEQSNANMENLDMKEMLYNPTQKDKAETKIHHMLSENLFMPRNRPRRMSYSRHAINEEDIASNHPVNYKVHMQVRRMVSEKNRKRKKTTEDSYVRPTNGTLRDGENEGDIRKIVRVVGSSKKLKDALVHQVIKETEEEHSMRSEIEPDNEEAGGIVFTTHASNQQPSVLKKSPRIVDDDKPAWLSKGVGNPAYEKDVEEEPSDHEQYEPRQAIQTRFLPWKREDADVERSLLQIGEPMKQLEFPPSWATAGQQVESGDPRLKEEDIALERSTLPPPVMHFVRRKSIAEPGSTLLPEPQNGPTAGKRHSTFELEHEALAPQVKSRSRGHHGRQGQKQATEESSRRRSPVPTKCFGDPCTSSPPEEDMDGTEEGATIPSIVINFENEEEKL